MANDRDIELNPLFFVPPGVIDVRQENQEDASYVYDSGASGNNGGSGNVAVGPILPTPDATVPSAPATYSIVKQTIRQTADGSTVVDVELEFPDIGVDVDVRVHPV